MMQSGSSKNRDSAQLSWENDQFCFVCGKRNESGLKADFFAEGESASGGNFIVKTLKTKCTFEKKHQGFKDVVHGGFIGMLLDEVMVNLTIQMGLNAVTAEMTFRLKRPARVGEEITFVAKNAKSSGRLITVEADALAKDGSLIAKSQAKLFRVNK